MAKHSRQYPTSSPESVSYYRQSFHATTGTQYVVVHQWFQQKHGTHLKANRPYSIDNVWFLSRCQHRWRQNRGEIMVTQHQREKWFNGPHQPSFISTPDTGQNKHDTIHPLGYSKLTSFTENSIFQPLSWPFVVSSFHRTHLLIRPSPRHKSSKGTWGALPSASKYWMTVVV